MRLDVPTCRQHLDELEALVHKADKESSLGDEEVARLSEYLVVRVSGFIEVSVHEILSDYASHTSKTKELATFVDAKLDKEHNLNEEKICQMLGCFSKEWSGQVKASLSGNLKESIDSVVNLRNALSHGGQTGVTPETATAYCRDILQAMRIVAKTCNPDVEKWFS